MDISQIEHKISQKEVKVGIIGLGYVGLPLAVAFAQSDIKVIGFELQADKVDAINRGESYIDGITNECLSGLVGQKMLEATTDMSRIQEVDAVSICVPTPLKDGTKEPDLGAVAGASESVARHLKKGQLVVLESTTYPGTTREIVLPILECNGNKLGEDFYLAYSPERVDPGNKKFTVKNTPKLVGGIDADSGKLAEQLYKQAIDTVILVASAEVAEMSKVFENTFRNVNIALVNELALLCEKMGISVWDTMQAASSKPFGFLTFYPGPGVGGHCIPVDPHYLSKKARTYDFVTQVIDLATAVNDSMPGHVVARTAEILSKCGKSIRGANLLVLGAAFKKDIDDCRESPALEIIHLLSEGGANVAYNDPLVRSLQVGGHLFKSTAITEATLMAMDCVIIATDHSAYDYQCIVTHARSVFDTRGATRGLKSKKIVRLGE